MKINTRNKVPLNVSTSDTGLPIVWQWVDFSDFFNVSGWDELQRLNLLTLSSSSAHFEDPRDEPADAVPYLEHRLLTIYQDLYNSEPFEDKEALLDEVEHLLSYVKDLGIL